ncbi:acyltransferase family protein [Mesorhizobium australicum]|uniref:Peptidoglycan/LPS O-acetylase OafA/YrhL, contains acyltransferase and SGNH-hydrolase domains n=1 Tax=Mesorhizobium australicum TaxID=536018 RepID=A0A1X7NRG0_9HYPH|nr:acyltransferase [Mesorhizobium australicum]SMH40710.1 Peptidoglycan/LPS O-acetylase OafA/YrhL, contains acyltransferase and SGNH-hydrolase domains [Mesorhizobium australicum]
MISTNPQSIKYNLQTEKFIGTLETIQLLRFIAAALVLFTHISFYVHQRADKSFEIWHDGTQGVGLFFVISGFIMTVTTHHSYASDGAAWKFTVSRLIRIVPLYWAVNAAKLLGLVVVPEMIVANPDVKNVILSLLFLPSRNTAGQVEAFYGVGWTLNFEMMFYALFALALVLRLRPSLMVIPILLIAVLLSFAKNDSWPAAAFLLDWRLLYFVWGILIGQWYVAGRTLPVAVAIGLIIFGFMSMFFPLGVYEILLMPQLHIAALIMGFVALERRISHKIPRFVSFLGDTSYSLYLTHPMIGVLAVLALHRFAGEMPSWMLFVLASAICIALSALTFVIFERPVTQLLRKRFMPR